MAAISSSSAIHGQCCPPVPRRLDSPNRVSMPMRCMAPPCPTTMPVRKTTVRVSSGARAAAPSQRCTTSARKPEPALENSVSSSPGRSP